MACQVFFQCKDPVQLMFSTAGQFALCWDNQLISTTLKLIDKASNISIRPFFNPSEAVILFARSSQEQRFSAKTRYLQSVTSVVHERTTVWN